MHRLRYNYGKVSGAYEANLFISNHTTSDTEEHYKNKFCGNQVRMCQLPISKGDRYYGNVEVMTPSGQYQAIRALIDSGNDVSILTNATAVQLGFHVASIKERFFVRGINGEAKEFAEVKTKIKICNQLSPIPLTLGLALDNDALTDNLIGRKDVFDNGKIEIAYDDDSITFREKSDRVTTCS